jgi:hypothetical protein
MFEPTKSPTVRHWTPHVNNGEPRTFFREGVLGQEVFRGVFHQIQLKTDCRERGDLGAVAPWPGVPLNLQIRETRILIRLLRMYFPRNREFGTALSKLRNFGGGGGWTTQTPKSTPLVAETVSDERNKDNTWENVSAERKDRRRRIYWPWPCHMIHKQTQ